MRLCILGAWQHRSQLEDMNGVRGRARVINRLQSAGWRGWLFLARSTPLVRAIILLLPINSRGPLFQLDKEAAPAMGQQKPNDIFGELRA